MNNPIGERNEEDEEEEVLRLVCGLRPDEKHFLELLKKKKKKRKRKGTCGCVECLSRRGGGRGGTGCGQTFILLPFTQPLRCASHCEHREGEIYSWDFR